MADVLEIHDGRDEEFAADEEEDRMLFSISIINYILS